MPSTEERYVDCDEESPSGSPSAASIANGWGGGAAAAVAHARPLALRDFERVLESFRPSGVHAQEYRQQQASNGQVRNVLFRGSVEVLGFFQATQGFKI